MLMRREALFAEHDVCLALRCSNVVRSAANIVLVTMMARIVTL